MLDQEENGVTNISDNLDFSWDCCSDYQNPHRTPRIYPRKPTMDTGTNINLYLKLVHPYCYVSCFTWRILSGGGYLDPEFGIETYYHAPPENELCGQNPTIEARCPREQLDVVQIGINGYKVRKLACFDIGSWREGSIIVDKKPLKMPPPTKHFWGLEPEYAATRIFHRDCAGKVLRTTAVGLIQMPWAWGHPELGRLQERWQMCYYHEGKFMLSREYGPTYGKAKYWLLRQHLAPYIDMQMPTGETVAHWFPFWRDWAAEMQPAAGSVADVRNWAQLKEGCCNQYLVRELDELPGRAL